MAAGTVWQWRWEGLSRPRDPCGDGGQWGWGEIQGPSTGTRPAACCPPPPAGCPARAPGVAAVARTRAPGGGGGGPRRRPSSGAAAELLKSARARSSRRPAAGVAGVRARACRGDRGRLARARTPERARPALGCVGGWRGGRRPDCVTFPVQPAVDSSSQRSRELPRCARLGGASLVAQRLRICLPMQGTRVRALVWEDPTCHGATRPVSHNY
nr:uncharacterized protein LOC132421214 [Delphinus delphis]